MKTSDLILLGSSTAKRGFQNEKQIIAKFENWRDDSDSQSWLITMGYDLSTIDKVEAIQLHGYKTDVQVKVIIYYSKLISSENISIKLVSNPRGFNQVDKRWVDVYSDLWNIPARIAVSLKLFTGEVSHKMTDTKDSRRLLLSELSSEDKLAIISFFQDNKILVISDLLRGRGQFAAGWMLVCQSQISQTKYGLKTINEAMNYFGSGDVFITEKGSLKIGRVTMQRKGGDGGRKTACMLQFKINPAELFDLKDE